MLEKHKKDFILNAVLDFTILDSFRRNQIYADNIADNTRENFKNAIKQYFKDNLQLFLNPPNINGYINMVFEFSAYFSANFVNTLANGRLRIGTSQKLIGMFLKYLWIFGYIDREPPLCPFDGEILQFLNLQDSWTTLDDVNIYTTIIQTAKRDADAKGLSLAQWELQTYNKKVYNQ